MPKKLAEKLESYENFVESGDDEGAEGALVSLGASESRAKALIKTEKQSISEKFRALPPDFVFEIALGMEDEEDIAERFGLSKEEYEAISALKAFQIAVKKVRSDLDKNGDMFRNKAHIMAEKVMDSGFAKAIDSTTPLKETTEFLKVVANLADLNPKPAANAVGSGFSVNIVLPELDRRTLDITEKAKADALATMKANDFKAQDAVVAIEIPEEKKDGEKEEKAEAVSGGGGDGVEGHGS